MAIRPVLDDTSLVLDTDILTDWRFQKPYVQEAIDGYISRLKQPPALTSTNVFEVLKGFENKSFKSGGLDERTKRDLSETEKLIQYCDVLPFDQNAAAIAAFIFPRLSQRARNKHWCDVFIAATALAHGYGVATRNQKDFKLITDHLPLTHPILRLAVWKP